ncbi:MAG: hypothetical protein LBB23_05030 [Rickettsiales bacterium]|jgi:hypothetical protein|nr:hypothetical protein [Rickettsiales bacterium]
MEKAISFFVSSVFTISATLMGAADAATWSRTDPRINNVYSAGQGAANASVSISTPELGGGTGVNLLTEAPALIEQQKKAAEAAEQARLTKELPIRVANHMTEMKIRNGDNSAGVDLDDLHICASISVGATFAWDKPTIKTGIGHIDMNKDDCVMEVELRMNRPNKLDPNRNEQLSLARMNVPYGTIVDCHLDSFPSEGYLPDIMAAGVELPADRAPEMADVEKVMNSERKQNAWFKVLGAAVIGGVGGNMLSQGNSGKMVGLKDIGGAGWAKTLGGAAIGAGGMYVAQESMGYQGGTMLESAMMGGAGGAVLGNMTAGLTGYGDDVLKFGSCDGKDSDSEECIWGFVYDTSDMYENVPVVCDVNFNCRLMGELVPNQSTFMLSLSSVNSSRKYFLVDADVKNAGTAASNSSSSSAAAPVPANNKPWNTTKPVFCRNFKAINAPTCTKHSDADCIDKKQNSIGNFTNDPGSNGEITPTTTKTNFLIGTCTTGGTPRRKFLNLAASGCSKPKNTKDFETNCKKDDRKCSDTSISQATSCKEFEPAMISATDGGILDLSNKARNKATLIGAAGGAGVGGFSGYKRAEDEMQQRLFAAQKEWEESQKKFGCYSGAKFFGVYGQPFNVPLPPKK